MGRTELPSVDVVLQRFSEHDYFADRGLATSIFLASELQRPLLLEGDAGVGKTEVAKVIAAITGAELIRLQCYEGIDVSQALYEWNYTRQLLHLRTAEATGEAQESSSDSLEDELFTDRFLIRRPLLQAIDHRSEVPPVLLIDMYKPPGIAETLDWANALHLLAETELTEASVDATLGTLLKYREDQERARRAGIESVIEIALGA